MEGFQTGDTIIRHGDVLLKKTDDMSIEGLDIAQQVLHQGLNHKHILSGKFRYEVRDGKTYVQVIEPSELSHEEHRTLLLPTGTYLMDIEREYDHWEEESRQVID